MTRADAPDSRYLKYSDYTSGKQAARNNGYHRKAGLKYHDEKSSVADKKWSPVAIVKAVSYWCWPLIFVGFLYLLKIFSPGLFQAHDVTQAENPQTAGVLVVSHPLQFYQDKNQYTISVEEKAENKSTALVRAVVKIDGSWTREAVLELMRNLEARYRRRTDFYNHNEPTDIIVYVVKEYQEKGDEFKNYIACLSAHADMPVKVEWNARAMDTMISGSEEHDNGLMETAVLPLRRFYDARPEISVLPGQENPYAFQVSITDYAYRGNPKEYVASAARAAARILKNSSKPCEGIFIALFEGNYYLSPACCLTAAMFPGDSGNELTAMDLVWENTDKFEYLQ